MRIAIIGAAGQLGRALQRRLGEDGVPLTHADIDITDAATVKTALENTGATAVVNAAAYNLVDRAESEPQAAYAVNALGPRNLADVCESVGWPLVHVSTDYVFGQAAQRRTPYSEDDPPGPLSAYGISKLAGEYFVRSRCSQHFVVRTCGLYGPMPTPGRGNFVETILRLAAERDELKIVEDQRCTPTSVDDLASAVVALLQTDAYGLYHATNAGETTWHEFAQTIVTCAGRPVPVRPITSTEFAAPARRPSYSVLDCSRLTRETGYQFRPWREALHTFLDGRRA